MGYDIIPVLVSFVNVPKSWSNHFRVPIVVCSGSSGSAPSLALPWLPSTTRWSSGPSRSRAGPKAAAALPRHAGPRTTERLHLWCLVCPRLASPSIPLVCLQDCCAVLLSEPRTCVFLYQLCMLFQSWRFKLWASVASFHPAAPICLCVRIEWADIMWKCEPI